MALQILNPQRSFGEELGRSLSSGLSRLAENKLQQLHFSDALKQSNYSDAQIALLNQLPANQRLEALQSLAPAGRGQQLQQQMQPQLQPDQQAISLMERMQGLGTQPEPLSQQELMGEFQANKLQQMGLGGQGAGPSADVQTLLNEAARQGMVLTDEQKQKLGRKVQEIYADQNKRKALEEDVMKYVAQQQAGQQAPGQALQQQAPMLQEPLLAQAPFKKPLTAAERIAQEKLEMTKRKEEREAEFKTAREERAQQKEIDIQNKAFNERLDKVLPAAENIESIATQMKELLETGKVANDIAGTILDRYGVRTFLNAESQRFSALANELADALAGQGGVASKYRIQVKQEAKPNLSQKFQAQVAGVEDILYKALKPLTRNEIRRDIISKIGKQPKNLEILVEKELEKREKGLKESAKVKQPKEERHFFGLLPVKHSATGL